MGLPSTSSPASPRSSNPCDRPRSPHVVQDHPEAQRVNSVANAGIAYNTIDNPRLPVVVDDVTIPAGIVRAASRSHDWRPDFGEKTEHHQQQRAILPDFSIVDIALEQRRQIENASCNSTTSGTGVQQWDLEAGLSTRRQSSNLPTLIEGTTLDLVAPQRSRSPRGDVPTRQLSRHSRHSSDTVRIGPAGPPASRLDDAVLFRSLDSYVLKSDGFASLERQFSENVAPNADYLGVYEGLAKTDEEQSVMELEAAKATDASGTTLRKPSLFIRAPIAVAAAAQTVKQGAADLIRRSSLFDVYENAKNRSQHLQRKRWVQLLFEYTFYLIILCIVYFGLIGRPIWNGAVWWLYWLVNNRFTVAGTWSITVGMGFFYAYAPLFIFFEKEPPMPDHQDQPQEKHATAVADTALLVPCYKSAQIIGPTLVAALKIFPAKSIFVIANGNSPTPLDNTEEVCQSFGVNHVWSPIGSKIVAQYVGCHAARAYTNVLLIDDDCALPLNFPIVSDRLGDKVQCIGYTIKSVGPDSTRGTMCQQAQDLEYKLSGLQRALAGKIGSATFPHGAISLWNTAFLIDTFRTHPGFSVSEDWFFGHAARKLGSRVTMCSAIFVETETPSAVLFSSGRARGGFGEMTVFKQRFYRWNFFFVNGIFYNMAYILGSWKLGFWELGAKIFVFQEVYETMLYLLAPFVLPISFVVRPAFCAYLLAATLGLYYINVTIFNEIHLRRRNERVGWVCVYLYYTPYKILLTLINVCSCYYSLYKYAKYFAQRYDSLKDLADCHHCLRANKANDARHPKIIEDEKAIEIVLRLEETAPSKESPDDVGRRLTVTAIGSRLSSDPRGSTSVASIAAGTPMVTSPPKVLLDPRPSRRVGSLSYCVARPSTDARADQLPNIAEASHPIIVDFAALQQGPGRSIAD